MNAFTDFFGRFHPLLVHLPIGFLLMALVLQWLCNKRKYASIEPAVPVAFLLGMVSAVLSCISGWSLAAGGEYEETTLELHRWMGIGVAVVSVAAYWFSQQAKLIVKSILAVVLFLLILLAGHLGGTLTHGEGFLTRDLPGIAKDSASSARKTIVDVQEAQVFADIIQPVLLDKCGTCHSAKKQKGGLRLDGQEWILKGGKEGKVVTSGNAEASELYKRILLDPLEEKHMPPKGKPQLTEQEIALLHWWISSNAAFDKKVKEVEQPANLKPALLAMQSAAVTMQKPAIPEEPVEPAAPAVLDSLRNAGIVVLPVAANSNYLLANFVSIPQISERTVGLLQQINKQLVWLKLGYASLTDNSWKLIGQCTNLTRLQVDHTNLMDATIQYLSSLRHLQYLNLVGTKVTAQGIQPLKGLTKLESLYLGQTQLKGNDIAALQKLFPQTKIDSGNYRLENLATDTQVVKAPAVKK